jgi:hypothetical protein
MSLMLLVTTAFDRVRARTRSYLPDSIPAVPRREGPRDRRDRLRHDVKALGGNPTAIETIVGNCPDQIKQQIGDLNHWLAGRRRMADVS